MQIIQSYRDWKQAKEQVADIIYDLKMISAKDESSCKAYPCSCDSPKEDISVYGIICGDCEKYKKSIQLVKAQRQLKMTKQKFLNSFMFWKTK